MILPHVAARNWTRKNPPLERAHNRELSRYSMSMLHFLGVMHAMSAYAALQLRRDHRADRVNLVFTGKADPPLHNLPGSISQNRKR